MLKRKIKVGYDDLEIKKIEFHPSKDNDSFGEFKSAASTIEIAKGMQPRQEANTFLHEILHACVYQSGLNSEGGALYKNEDEEVTVNALANSFSQVVRDNQWFLPYLQKGLFGAKNGIEEKRVQAMAKTKKQYKKRALRKN